jgi:hypothetical protein
MMPRNRISISILRRVACSLLLLLAVTATAQGTGQQRLSKDEQLKLRMKAIDDSIPLWRGIQVKADLMGVIQRGVSSTGQYEAGVRVNLKDKYFPVVEIGLGQADETNISTNTHYTTSAPYGKIGMDFNILKNRHDIYRLYAGVRYAFTSFKFDIDRPDVTDPVWGDEVPFSLHDVKAQYHWMEIVFGTEAKIVGPVSLGWSFRYRRRIAHNDGDYGYPWYVPGFGKQGSSRMWGSFEIMVNI